MEMEIRKAPIIQPNRQIDLNIGYFNIAFQSDDNTLNAVSNIDDLSTQDVSEISTKTYNQ